MFLYPETLVIGLPLIGRESQATHFSHQARPFKKDSEEAKMIRNFLEERAAPRKDDEKIWDFPDGSSVAIDSNGIYSVVAPQEGFACKIEKFLLKLSRFF